MDGTNIASSSFYKRRKVERSGKINLESFRKTQPLPTKEVVNDSSESTAYKYLIVEEKPEDEEARCNTN